LSVNDGSRFVDRQQILKVVKPDHQPHSCMTFDGQPGTCLSARECYPYTKVHQSLSSNETWVIGSLGTCHLSTEANGRQVQSIIKIPLCNRENNALVSRSTEFAVIIYIAGRHNLKATTYLLANKRWDVSRMALARESLTGKSLL
jgi:hypothetical protein